MWVHYYTGVKKQPSKSSENHLLNISAIQSRTSQIEDFELECALQLHCHQYNKMLFLGNKVA